jgi:PPOX class probable F420-dependent enzyme
MSHDEWRAFLRSPVRPAVLATTHPDGRPHVAPVWYDLDDDDRVVFNTGAQTVKGRNLRHGGQVSLCVQDDQPPFAFVMISGRAVWSGDVAVVRPWAARIGGRYMGADRAEEFGARNGVPGELVVWVTPERIVAHKDISD